MDRFTTELLILAVYLLLGPFLYVGIINRVKALWCGRKGYPLLQLLHDVVKLLRKGEVFSTTTTGVFIIAPVIAFGAVLFSALVVPGPAGTSVLSFEGDYLFFAYALSLAKFAGIIGAMDTGSSFEGMGASREASYTSLVEPAYMIVITTAVYATGFLSFQDILMVIQGSKAWSLAAGVPIIAALVIMLLAEGCRVPVDDPKTHLELTMIHEVMVLDNSGPGLALVNYTAGLKLCVIGSLIASVSIPVGISGWLYALLFFAIVAATAVLVGIIESLNARVRMSHVPQFVFTMISGAVLVLSISFLTIFGGAK